MRLKELEQLSENNVVCEVYHFGHGLIKFETHNLHTALPSSPYVLIHTDKNSQSRA
jgi:hypothetical protein